VPWTSFNYYKHNTIDKLTNEENNLVLLLMSSNMTREWFRLV